MPEQPAELLDQLLLAFLAILPVVNPFAKPPIFLSITEGLTPEERKRQAFKACVYAFVILIVSLASGTLILEFFSISLPALQIAGGMLIARTAFDMLRPQREHHQTEAEEKESRGKEDISFVPLALPLLSGPGSIAVMINLSTHTELWADWLVIGVASLGVCVISYVVLIESVRLTTILGVNGMNALSKLMGFLLLSLAVQFIINGVSAAFTTLAHNLHASV
ncbi:MAG TPA: MarC family NAAT transporter [Candidatus Methylacidiphilales bacterium]|nr:MarC family NAAT transporter [Candidatus Methylacidiphilales bacterium]